MDINDLAQSMFGTTRANARTDRTSTVVGVATSDSDNGIVNVDLNSCDVPLEVPTSPVVREGQHVLVTIVNGRPTVVAAAGSGDDVREEIADEREAREQAILDATQKADAGIADVRKSVDDTKADIASFKESAAATYATKTEVDDKTGALTKTIEADYLKADDASTTYATKTELTESADGVEQRVSETYATKKSLTDYEGTVAKTYATQSDVKQTTDSISQTVEQHYTELTEYEKSNDAAVGNAQADATKANDDLAAYKGTVSKTYATQTALDQTNESIDAKASETLSSAKSYADGKVETEVVDRDAAIKVATDNVTLQASQTYATKTELTESADGVEQRVSETYATNAKLQVLRDSIVSAVSGEVTYTAPDGSTQTNELATKVEQTDTSLTTTISRTDALETMVHEYSGGVLVSKIKNGATVNGALVNADGSFDVVNVTWNSGTPTVGKKLMRLTKNRIEFNNPDTSYNICNITANGTLTNIDVPNGSLAIDEIPAWCQALGDSGYDSFIAGKMLQLGAGNRTTHSEILIEPDGTTIDGYKFALGTNNTTDTWVPVIGGNRNAGYLVHRSINLKWGPNAYAVYCAYNPDNGGEHYYTTHVDEYNRLVKSGWTGNGVYFYAAL